MKYGPLTGPSHSQVAYRQHQPLSGRKDSHTLAHTLSRCTHWDAQMLLQSRWVWWLHMGGSQSQKLHMWKSGSWTQKSTSYQVVVIMVPCSQRVILVMQDLSCLKGISRRQWCNAVCILTTEDENLLQHLGHVDRYHSVCYEYTEVICKMTRRLILSGQGITILGC